MTSSSPAFVKTLQATLTQPGGPAYIAVNSVAYDCQLPSDPKSLKIPGLLLCQIIGESGERTLLTVWQSESHFAMNNGRLERLALVAENPTVVRRGFQGQLWSKESQQTFAEYIWTWEFFKNVLAVCGVVGGLYAFFQPIFDYVAVFPQHSALSPDTPHEAIERYPSILSVQVRNDSVSGTSDFEISAAYLTAIDAKQASDTLPPVIITSAKKIARIKSGDATSVALDCPQLPPGRYRLFLKLRQDAGLLWKVCGFGHDDVEVRQVSVIPELDVKEPKEMVVLKERNGKVNARYHLRVTPGFDCESIFFSLTLDSKEAKATSVLGIESKEKSFESETRDLSGVEWTVHDAKAKQSLIIPVVIVGPPGTDWDKVRSKVTFTSRFMRKD